MKKFLALALVISNAIFSQIPKINFVEYDLPNGLHVILHQDKSAPVVAVTVTYHVGAKNEYHGRTGFAHFFEHLMFEGSPNIKRGEFFKIVQNAGGELNAYTSFDQTVYYEILPSNQAELALWLESERMLHLRIDSIGVETQRGVVLEEMKQRYDNQPYGRLLPSLMSAAFKVHPYKVTPIGLAEDIQKATLEEFYRFHKTYYVPNNAVLSISGDFEIEPMKQLVEKYFGEIPKGQYEMYRPGKEVEEPAKTAEVIDTVYDKIQLPALVLGYHIPEQSHPDFYALNMLTTLLSQGNSSRLYKELVDNKQIAVTSAAFPFFLEQPGLFIFYTIAAPGINVNDILSVIDAEIEKVKNEPIGDNEFIKLKNQTEKDFVNRLKNQQGIAIQLADYHIFGGGTDNINNEWNKFDKVTKEDLKRVAEKYLTKNNRVVLYYLPQPKK
jgi:predicted Zn-dependent peptidase